MKGLHKTMHDMFNAICRHKSNSGAAKSVALADVSEALHYSKQGRDPVVSLFDINERKVVKQGEFSISLFYPPGNKCLRSPNLST